MPPMLTPVVTPAALWTGVLKEGWSSASVLGVGEALKFAISLGMMAADEQGSEAPKGQPA